jgi:hypothetical protein
MLARIRGKKMPYTVTQGFALRIEQSFPHATQSPQNQNEPRLIQRTRSHHPASATATIPVTPAFTSSVTDGDRMPMNASSKVILVAAGALAFATTTASAEIACNQEGDCWHVKRHDFHPDLKLTIHPDNWKWAEHLKYRWREHEGHGYWRNGTWIEIK